MLGNSEIERVLKGKKTFGSKIRSACDQQLRSYAAMRAPSPKSIMALGSGRRFPVCGGRCCSSTSRRTKFWPQAPTTSIITRNIKDLSFNLDK